MASRPTLAIKLDANSSELLKEYQRVKAANKQLKKSNDEMSGSFAAVARSAKQLAAAYLSFTAVKDLGGFALKTAADFETLNASLETVFGSQSKANVKFKELNDFAASTPFTLQEITEAAIRMKSLGLDPSTDALKSMGNTASALGKPLMQFTEAVADAVVGEFERLKEFGIKSSSEGDKVKFTFQGITTEIGKNAEEINEYLLNIGNTNFAGAIEKQADTLAGRMSTLGGAVDQLAVKFAEETGLADAVKESTKELSDFITQTLLAEATIEQLQKKVEDFNKIASESREGSTKQRIFKQAAEDREAEIEKRKKEDAEAELARKEIMLDREIQLELAAIEKKKALDAEIEEARVEKEQKDEEAQQAKFERDLERLTERNMTEKELLQSQTEEELATLKKAFDDKLLLEEEYLKQVSRVRDRNYKEWTKIQTKSNKEEIMTSGQKFRSLLGGLAQYSTAANNINKAFKARDAIVDAHAGAVKTMAAYPYPINIGLAGLHYASAFGMIASLKSESPSVPTGESGSIPTDTGTEIDNLSTVGETEEERAPKRIVLNVQGLEDAELVPKQFLRNLIDQINDENESNVRVVM